MMRSDEQSLSSKKSSSQVSYGTNPFSDSSSKEHTHERGIYQAPEVAKQEEANILRAKILVAVIILSAASGVGSATYLLIKDQEKTNFENQFAGYASEIITVARQKSNQLFAAVESFSTSISSHSETLHSFLGTNWPFYANPNWSIMAEQLVELTGVADAQVSFAVVVQQDEYTEFSFFAEQAIPQSYRESIRNENIDMTAEELWNRTIPFIHSLDPENDYQPIPLTGPEISAPLVQHYPLQLEEPTPILSNTIAAPGAATLFNITGATGKPTIGFTVMRASDGSQIVGSQVIHPIFDSPYSDVEDKKHVASAGIRLHWLDYFKNILTEGESGIIVVLRTACPDLCNLDDGRTARAASYRIDGSNAEFLGDSDLHNPKFDSMEISGVFVDLGIDESQLPEGVTCVPTLSLHVYPSEDLEMSFQTNEAVIYTIVVAVIFIFTSLVFLLYDYFVRRRQTKVMERIMRQDKIVSNVFPTAIRDRLYQGQEKRKGKNLDRKLTEDFDLDFDGDSNISGSAPLADLFPSITVVFADISGFTAWSSAREPQQVFVLLETLYGAFDKIAYRHSVFKVETVGDCYVAAVGLPEPVEKHAVVACKFARDCLKKMKEITLKLEVTLGPDTGDLDLRTGIHSGQVTAGVLRGERSRFQLFGDTMNTAARMEQSGERNRIQLSQASADMLTEDGLAQWIMPRSRKIYVKGKGDMQTYWLRKSKGPKPKGSDLKSDMSTLAESGETGEESDSLEDIGLGFGDDYDDGGMTKIGRLVEWNVEVLAPLLQQIIASRGGVVNDITTLSGVEQQIGKGGGTVLDEFTPIIPLKRFEAEDLRARQSPSSIDIGDEAKSQLRSYLSQIACMYHDKNPFHNFHHASHVTASVKKLLTRIVKVGEGNGLAVSSSTYPAAGGNDENLVDLLAGHSYGITSDPLTQFAVLFSAIIHDVDHPGVPNAQLVKERTRNAQIYKKSVAEQNSVELAWDVLMSDEYSSLRACIYQTEADLRRFRQLVVNAVMATDI
eukprot:scaffold1479_cov127-Cylindrotheca_fusiformis.AAC.1